jgi:predicted DCC family thiol-disulfide oxidoreductase YuxK
VVSNADLGFIRVFWDRAFYAVAFHPGRVHTSAVSWVLFFDGECAFCSRSVRIVARHDRRRCVWFAPLQGKLAAEHGLSGMAAATGGTMVLLREADGAQFTRSDALIELARALGGIWHLARVAVLVPRPLRDAVYQWIADRRQRLAVMRGSCPLPDADVTARLRE